VTEKVRMHKEEDCTLLTVEQLLRRKGAAEDHIRSLPADALTAKMRIFEEGSDVSPQLFESHVPANIVAPIHSHTEDEIIYILEGEMLLGTKSLPKGSSLFVAANVRYGFKAGPEGVRFLNFRPHRCDF
jgi:quercetin dioxygenase-like cupin family protein